MNNTHFGAIHYDIHLDMKLDKTISRIFQEMSFTKLGTLHQLFELERTQFLQFFIKQYLKSLMRDIYCQETDQTFLTRKKCIMVLQIYQKSHLYMFVKTINAIIKYQNSTKIKYILLIHSVADFIFGIQQSHVDQKKSHNVVQLKTDEN